MVARRIPGRSVQEQAPPKLARRLPSNLDKKEDPYLSGIAKKIDAARLSGTATGRTPAMNPSTANKPKWDIEEQEVEKKSTRRLPAYKRPEHLHEEHQVPIQTYGPAKKVETSEVLLSYKSKPNKNPDWKEVRKYYLGPFQIGMANIGAGTWAKEPHVRLYYFDGSEHAHMLACFEDAKHMHEWIIDRMQTTIDMLPIKYGEEVPGWVKPTALQTVWRKAKGKKHGR